MADIKPSVLDPAQLNRIEAVHRGFLYQHLFAVACLLRLNQIGAASLAVETDEDVELVLQKRRIYIQVKTRGEPLGESDIAGVLERFAQIRKKHEEGKRAGQPSFVIVANVEPGQKLAAKLAAADWPLDVAVVSPGRPPSDKVLPEVWRNIPEALENISLNAAQLPFSMLAPETLVLKLAAVVMMAAAGTPPRSDHSFQADEASSLLEQVAIQLQDFPAPPPQYRPQDAEPALVSDLPIRVVAGFSGAGKTAWVAQAATHSGADLAYFDIGDNPSAAIAVPLARELAGRFFGKGGRLGEILLPGASGLDMLRGISERLKKEGVSLTLVIDNAHRASGDDLREVINRLTGVRLVFLCQPGLTVQSLEVLLNVTAENLSGWSPDTIAADVADAGCRPTPESIELLRQQTGGLPLYIQNAAQITAKDYRGDLAAFCNDLAQQAHTTATAQEVILAKTFDGFPQPMKDAAAVLSISDIPLEHAEATKLLKRALDLPDAFIVRFVRHLRPTGSIEVFGRDRIKIHDAVRLLARAHLDNLGAEAHRNAYQAFRDILLGSVKKARDFSRLSLLIRVFAELGEIKPLVDLATDDIFHEFGVIRQIYDVLDRASEDASVAPNHRFSAIDALIFTDLREKNLDSAQRHIDAMVELAKKQSLDESDQLTLAMKQMLYASARKDAKTVIEQLKKSSQLLPKNPVHERIFRYNAAYALFQLGQYDDCVATTTQLIEEYYKLVGLTVADVMGNNPDKIWPLLPKGRDLTDDLKHLADSLDLQACALGRVGNKTSSLCRIHAMKFYAMVNAVDSLVRVGQDLADEFLDRHDYIGARQVLETNVIPNVTQLKLTSRMVPVRAHYAVVLAHCGDFAAADREMKALEPYEKGMTDEQRREITGQRADIARLKVRPPPPQWTMPAKVEIPPFLRPKKKIGRNDLCICGSGKKYKKCHGA